MKSLLNGFILVLSVVTLTTVVKFTSVKFDEHYVPPIETRIYPRLKVLPSIRINDPSLGTQSPIVRLYQEDGMPLCSGVVISSNYILTAAHCLLTDTGKLSSGKITVKSSDKTISVEATAASAYPRTDVGLITGNFSQFKYAKVETQTLRVFNSPGPFLSCGFPLGGEMFCNRIDGFSYSNFFLVSNGVLIPGMSGGPILSMVTGYVIGVNSAMVDSISVYGPTLELFTVLGVEVVL